MRQIELIILHCSAVLPSQQSSAADIDRWHRMRGWCGIGYHYVVRRNGLVETGRPESRPGAHCAGFNEKSLGVCYEGGLDSRGIPADTRTPLQRRSLIILLRYLLSRHPQARIVGHRELNPHKACPCFDASEYRLPGGLALKQTCSLYELLDPKGTAPRHCPPDIGPACKACREEMRRMLTLRAKRLGQTLGNPALLLEERLCRKPDILCQGLCPQPQQDAWPYVAP